MEGKCPVCGAPMENGVCGYCGYRDKSTQTQPNSTQYGTMPQPQIIINNQNVMAYNETYDTSRKNKITALLLCIFLGVFGIHRFYVGKVGTGILYMFTGGLFGIGWIIDIVLIASGSFKDSFGLPLR